MSSTHSRREQILAAAKKDRKRRRRERFLIILTALLVVGLLYLAIHVSRAAETSTFLQPFVIYFFNFAVWALILILILVLVFLIVRNVVKFIFERRRGVLGARIRMRLIMAFMALTIGPALVLFLLSIFILNTSIERLYDPHVLTLVETSKGVIAAADRIGQVSRQIMDAKYKADGEEAIHFGQELARSFLERGWMSVLTEDQSWDRTGAAESPSPPRPGEVAGCLDLSRRPSSVIPTDLEQLANFIEYKRQEYSLELVAVFDQKGRCVVSSAAADLALPEFPKGDIKKALAGEQGFNPPVPTEKSGAMIYAFYPIPRRGADKSMEIEGVVAVGRLISWIPEADWRNLAVPEDAKAVIQDYETLHQLELPMKLSYILLLVFVTLIVIFLAVWFGFYMAKGITEPIQLLAEGTEMVASGNLDYRIEVSADGDDEVSSLVRSFNKMTSDLHRSRADLDSAYGSLHDKNLELEQRRAYMETVLGHVAAAVISIDPDDRVSTVNPAAMRMLWNHFEDPILGRPFAETLRPEDLEVFRSAFAELTKAADEFVQRQFTLVRDNRSSVILVTVSRLRDDRGNSLGTVVVIDDLTELVRAHRTMAWREVARRIAHEIKNPLTPIQLAAQRLERRYTAGLSGEEAQIFSECTRTIIRQVEELKHLVDEFSLFARLPATHPLPTDLHLLIREVLPLYREAHPRINFQLIEDARVPPLELDPEQMKRVFINLLDNAVASMAGPGAVELETSYYEQLQIVRIELRDTGQGIPPHVRERIFEPYYSTKPHGTGIGLAIVQRIVADHYGYIRVVENPPQGTKIIIELPILQAEKTLASKEHAQTN